VEGGVGVEPPVDLDLGFGVDIMALALSLSAYCPFPSIRIAFLETVWRRHFWCIEELKAT